MAHKKSAIHFTKEEIMKKHDFNYIREHFYDPSCTLEDLRGDILAIYNETLDLTQLSAEGKNTVRVTNYFVNETQSKATSVRSKMSPHKAIFNDDALYEIFDRIDGHPRFFDIRKNTEEKLIHDGLIQLTQKDLDLYKEGKLDLKDYLMSIDMSNFTDLQKDLFIENRTRIIEQINLADLREVRRAVAHIPKFHRVSQFPNHVAQRIYERYAPKEGAVILDSSSGWGNRMMASLSSKNKYKYLGTDPNSEMHPNYRGIADIMYETLSGYDVYTNGRKYPEDYIDIRDQGSEFDIPEWHNNSGYDIIKETTGHTSLINKFTGKETELVEDLSTLRPSFEKWGNKHPYNGKGCCDTGKLNTTGANLEPIWQTHDPEVFKSGIGDVSFTSPPYFFLECYTEDSQNGDLSTGQSAGKGAKYVDWLRDFVYPTVVNHFNYLKPGGYYIYNLKDLPKDDLYLYIDWLSICLDCGFELIEQPEMILKSRRQFGRKEDTGEEAIDFKGGTERIGVLRKPLTPDAPTITNDHLDTLYHIQNNFTYPLIKFCRPKEFESKLPANVEEFLDKKFEGITVKTLKNHNRSKRRK